MACLQEFQLVHDVFIGGTVDDSRPRLSNNGPENMEFIAATACC